MLDQQDSPVEYLLKKNNVTLNLVDSKLDEADQQTAKNKRGEPAQSISRDANNVVLRAGAVLKQFGDEFVTPEHLLLAIVQGNDACSEIIEEMQGLQKKV